jgi:hypothetical protein
MLPNWKYANFIGEVVSGNGLPPRLMDLHHKDVESILLIRYIWALAFVPEDMVVQIWGTVISEKV